MPSYLVTWEIDIEADTPRAAAEEAREIQRRPDSWATVFMVHERFGGSTQIDLTEDTPAS